MPTGETDRATGRAAGAGIATVDLRETVAAGRGTLVDLSLPYQDWVRPPNFMVGEVTPALMRQYFAQIVVLGTSLYRVRDAEVTQEGLILTDGRLNLSNQLNLDPTYPGRHHPDLAASLPTLRRQALDEEVVLLAGAGHGMYGHWIVDFLPKLYLLHLAGCRLERLRFLLPAATPAFARDWLRLLGIGDDQLRLYDHGRDLVACRSLLVPTALRFGSRASPLLRPARAFLLDRAAPRPWRAWRPRWLRRRRRRPYRKLLVARSRNAVTINRRHLVEREAFEARALARGFEIVRPETLSIPDQIALFRSANALYGEYGSALHGSLFARPGTVVMAARPNGLELGFLQSSIDHVLGHESGYLVGGPEGEDGGFSVRDEDMDMAFDWLRWRGYA